MSTLFQMPADKPVVKRRFRRPAAFGIAALVCGIVSVLGAVVHSLWGPFTPAASFSDRVIGGVTQVTASVVSSVTGEAHAQPTPVDVVNADQVIKQTIVLLSVAGMLTAIVAYIRRENKRVLGSALVISGIAFATQSLLFPLVVIGVVAVLMLAAAVF
jgi:hypothetical protein